MSETRDINRCAVCGWQLDPYGEMCRRGNCSHRPLPDRFYDPERVKAEYGHPAPVERDPYRPTAPALTRDEAARRLTDEVLNEAMDLWSWQHKVTLADRRNLLLTALYGPPVETPTAEGEKP